MDSQIGARSAALKKGQIIFPTKSERWGKLAQLDFSRVSRALIAHGYATVIMDDGTRIIL